MTSVDIGYLLNRAGRKLRLDLAARLAPLGLRPQQGAVLMALGRSAEGRLTPRELAQEVDIDAPTVSGLIERLKRDGWVGSGPNPADGRSRLVWLSAQGSAVLPAVIDAAHATSREAVACLSAKDRRALADLLLRLCDADRDSASPAHGTR